MNELDSWLQTEFEALKELCRSKEEAQTYVPELIKIAQRDFYKDYYDIPGIAEDVFEEVFS